MIKLIAVTGFALALATSAEAMTPAPITQPDSVVTQVAFGCGPGRTRVGGVCVSAMPAERPADVHFGTEVFAVGGWSFARVGSGRLGAVEASR